MTGAADPADPAAPVQVTGGGEPSDEEVAAIVAAVEVAWPRSAGGRGDVAQVAERWRFSGRWWTKPVPLRRDRPW